MASHYPLFALVLHDPNSSDTVSVIALLPESTANAVCGRLNDQREQFLDKDQWFEVQEPEYEYDEDDYLDHDAIFREILPRFTEQE